MIRAPPIHLGWMDPCLKRPQFIDNINTINSIINRKNLIMNYPPLYSYPSCSIVPDGGEATTPTSFFKSESIAKMSEN